MSGRAAALALAALLLAPAIARAQAVEARLDRRLIARGETTTLRVVVRGGGSVRAPEFDVPAGLALVGSTRQQSFAWVNGRASAENEFRYEIEGQEEGRYALGPILVSVGGKSYRSGTLELQVSAAPPPTGSDGTAPATLRVEVRPRDPYLGQEVTLIVRLLQREVFAEDPQYTPPTTTGFWTDRPTAPESDYADERGERVLVTETRTRLYPLAIGEATVGEAAALVVVAGERADPFGFLGGSRRELVLRSSPVTVRVRPLPAGAPPGFGGAVGRFEVAWTRDRSRSSRDVPITLRLDVRGRGNVPLVRPPVLADPDVEILASTVDDSLATPGSDGIGRKRFQWTVLPNREGEIAIAAPAFAWFDPGAGTYRTPRLDPARVEVGPPVFSQGDGDLGFPRELADRPVDPAARPALPWAFALAGLSLGAAVRCWRRAAVKPSGGAGAHAWSVRLRAAVGADVWKVAEEASAWLASHPGAVSDGAWRSFQDRIAAARYGGTRGDPEPVRRDLLARLKRVTPAAARGIPLRLAALGLAAIAVASVVVLGPLPGSERAVAQCRAADQAARQGDVAKARSVWLELWRLHGGQAGLAARLAWGHIQSGEIGPAALWVMRGELVEPRDQGLAWVRDRVREAGGLVGASAARWPVRPLEWAVLALVSGLAAGWAWPRPWPFAAALAATLFAATAFPIQGWNAARSGRAVMVSAASLEGSDVELEPGQMVRARERDGARVRVSAGRVLDGWVPASSVARVVPPRGQDG